MRNVHRFISTALGSRGRAGAQAAAPVTAAAVDSHPYGNTGRLTSSPWEGLYLELDN